MAQLMYRTVALPELLYLRSAVALYSNSAHALSCIVRHIARALGFFKTYVGGYMIPCHCDTRQ